MVPTIPGIPGKLLEKHENDVCENLQFYERNKTIYTYALRISSFSLQVRTKNNNFIKEIKHVICASIFVENLGKVFENSRAGENP